METNQAAEHLQVIRTLMERSALYRRALAPIMLYCGILGVAGGLAGWLLKLHTDRTFFIFWSGIASTALIGAFLMVRRQALKDSEPFWSPPTRRVAQALLPAFSVAALVSTVIAYFARHFDSGEALYFIILWSWFYGCAIHSAGFFMVRGIKLLGWLFLVSGCVLFLMAFSLDDLRGWQPNLVMGGLFGGLHLAYGLYLYFTENRKTSP